MREAHFSWMTVVLPGNHSHLFQNWLLCQFLEGPTVPLRALLIPCPLLKVLGGASSPTDNNRDEAVGQAM